MEKIKKTCKKPVGGVFDRNDWCQKNPLTKRMFCCKINICQKDPQIANSALKV